MTINSHVLSAMFAATTRSGDGIVELARAADEQFAGARLARLRAAQSQFRYIMDMVDAAVTVEAEKVKAA